MSIAPNLFHVDETLLAQDEAFIQGIRNDFPILSREINGKPLVYLDNAASTQKPNLVIDRIADFYRNEYANIHRGVHQLSQLATNAYEETRSKVRRFINAAEDREIIFTRGTTESINLVMATYGRANIREGDEILITGMEHHSNIVPWQMLCEETGAVLRHIPISDEGQVLVDRIDDLINERTRFVSLIHVSNALGSITPVHPIIEKAHERGIPVLLDGAQSVPHMRVDVRELDVDFFAFSGHKMYGPSGVGVLYGKRELLEKMPPYQGGGDMILSVTFEGTTYNELPYKFEAGTPNIAGVVGLGAAIDYIGNIGLDRIARYEGQLQTYAAAQLKKIPGLRILGNALCKAAVISFVFEDIHPHDIGTILDSEGVAIRTGHHCAQPLMQRFKVPATARASMGIYNTREEIDKLVEAVKKTVEFMR